MTFLRMAHFPAATATGAAELADLIPSGAPVGRLLFAAGPARGGWQVVQVWESVELLDAFNRDVLRPALERLGDGAAVWVPSEVVDVELTQLSFGNPGAADRSP